MKALAPTAFAQVQAGPDALTLLKDGAQAYPAMLAAISRARSTVCLETYILRDDLTGRRFAEALCERARAGIEVNVLYDDWGSSMTPGLSSMLAAAGARTLAFRPVVFTGRFGKLLARLRRRDHRKALVVDGEVAFLGGLNISDNYASVADGGQGWRDTQVQLDGPAALPLQRLFLVTWARNGGAPLDPTRYAQPLGPPSGVRIVGNDFRADRKQIRAAYLVAIRSARSRIRLTHAYFLPPARIVRELQRAARRGVQVSIISAASSDVPLVVIAARGEYGKLLRHGIRIFEWSGPVLHAKTAVVDGRWATVGSANMDALSLRANLEVNAVLENEPFALALERMFEQDLAHCAEVTWAAWKTRPWYVRLLSSLVGRLRNWL